MKRVTVLVENISTGESHLVVIPAVGGNVSFVPFNTEDVGGLTILVEDLHRDESGTYFTMEKLQT